MFKEKKKHDTTTKQQPNKKNDTAKKQQPNKRTVEYWQEKYLEHLQNGKTKKREEAFNTGLMIATAKNTIIDYYTSLADLLFNNSYCDQSKQLIDEALEDYPGNECLQCYWWEKVFTLANNGHYKVKIAEEYALAPDQQELYTIPYWLKIADRLFEKDLFEASINAFEKAREIDPSNKTVLVYLWNKSIQAFSDGKTDLAIQAREHAKKTKHTEEIEIKYWLNITDINFRNNDFDGAKNTFKEAREIDPSNKTVLVHWWNKSIQAFSDGKTVLAIQAREHAKKTKHTEEIEIKYWLKITAINFRNNDFDGAKNTFKEAWEIDPKNNLNQRYWRQKFHTENKKGNNEKAQKALEFDSVYYPKMTKLNNFQFPAGDNSSRNLTQSPCSKTPYPSSSSQHSASLFKPARMKSPDNIPVSPETIYSLEKEDVDKGIFSNSKPSITNRTLDSYQPYDNPTPTTNRFFEEYRRPSLPEKILQQTNLDTAPANKRVSCPNIYYCNC